MIATFRVLWRPGNEMPWVYGWCWPKIYEWLLLILMITSPSTYYSKSLMCPLFKKFQAWKERQPSSTFGNSTPPLAILNKSALVDWISASCPASCSVHAANPPAGPRLCVLFPLCLDSFPHTSFLIFAYLTPSQLPVSPPLSLSHGAFFWRLLSGPFSPGHFVLQYDLLSL